MKLRNKKTGIVEYLLLNSYPVSGDIVLEYMDENAESGYSEYCRYSSLAELNAEWEDYVPKEPLIKDEKIRSVIRAWAEANDANVVSICALSGGWGVRYDLGDKEGYGSIDLLFKGNAPLGVGNQYTIDELCGEEEE